MAMYLGNQAVKILAPSINLFDKSLIQLGGNDFGECSEYELSADKNTMIARGKSDDTTMEFGYGRGWVRGCYYESVVNSKGIKLKKGDIVTVSADFTLIEQGNRSAAVRCYLQSNHPNVGIYDTDARSISETPQRITWKFTVTNDAVDFYPTFPINSNKVKIENISVNKVKDYWRIRSGVNMGRNPKNVLPFPYYNNSVTKNGITFTVNDDGTVTANGTATANAEFMIIQNRVPLNPNTQYILSGCPKQSGSNISIYVGDYKDGVYQKEYYDFGRGGYTFTAKEGHDYYSRILIRSGTTVDNVTFKPMLNEGTKALPYFYYD